MTSARTISALAVQQLTRLAACGTSSLHSWSIGCASAALLIQSFPRSWSMRQVSSQGQCARVRPLPLSLCTTNMVDCAGTWGCPWTFRLLWARRQMFRLSWLSWRRLPMDLAFSQREGQRKGRRRLRHMLGIISTRLGQMPASAGPRPTLIDVVGPPGYIWETIVLPYDIADLLEVNFEKNPRTGHQRTMI